jgi:hypothetical protein
MRMTPSVPRTGCLPASFAPVAIAPLGTPPIVAMGRA